MLAHLLDSAAPLETTVKTAIAMGRPSGLSQRVVTILDPRVNRQGVSIKTAGVVLTLAVVVFAGISCAHVRVGAASSPTAADVPAIQPRVVAAPATGTHFTRRSFVVTVLDNETGKPLDNVEILYDNVPEDGRVLTDAQGHATVTLAQGDIDPKLVLKCEHYLGGRVMWQQVEGGPPPPLSTCTLRLEPARPIGGKVIDDAGQPVAGANVEIWINGKQEYQSGLSFERPWTNRAVKTAADGTWQYDNSRAPIDAKSIMVAAWDYQHLGADYFVLREYTPVAELFAKTSILMVPRGVPVTGTVREPFHGNAIKGAKITFGANPGASNQIPPLTTDADGTFTFAVKPGVTFTITASSSGYKPQVQRYTTEQKPVTLGFHLTPLYIRE